MSGLIVLGLVSILISTVVSAPLTSSALKATRHSRHTADRRVELQLLVVHLGVMGYVRVGTT